MFRWPDAVAVLGITALAIAGGYLKVLPDKLVAALVMAAVGYVGAMTIARRVRKFKSWQQDQESERAPKDDGDGVPSEPADDADSGVVEVAAPAPGRRVEVRADGSVTIGPAREPSPHDDDTPVERRRPGYGTEEVSSVIKDVIKNLKDKP